MPFHIKYRPKTLDEFFGNKALKSSIQSLLKKENHPRCFLLQGESGCGKTTLARIMANEFNCDKRGIVELNAANTRGIDTIREISRDIYSLPLCGGNKAYIFDESHQFTKAAQEALLKAAEEIPDHAYMFFCTTDSTHLIKALKNRCTKFEVSLLRRQEIKDLLFAVCKKENSTIEDDIYLAIVKVSEGCPRQALILLEQVFNIESTEEALTIIGQAEGYEIEVFELCKTICNMGTGFKKTQRVFEQYKNLQKNGKIDLEKFRRMVLSYAGKVLLGANDSGKMETASIIIVAFEKPFYDSGEPGLINALYECSE